MVILITILQEKGDCLKEEINLLKITAMRNT